MNLRTAKKEIRSILGAEASAVFSSSIEEMMLYAKSQSMLDLESPEEVVFENLVNVAQNLVVEAVTVFLLQADMHSRGLHISGGEIRDDQKQALNEIVSIRQKQPDITVALAHSALKTFRKGRKLAAKIVRRAEKFRESKSPLPNTPPLEVLEAEAIRLEQKLPQLSNAESKRLALFYEAIRQYESA